MLSPSAVLCLAPHPAGASPSRAVCLRVLEAAVRDAPAAAAAFVVRLVARPAGSHGAATAGGAGGDDEGASIPEWRSRAEEIALYNEIHTLAVQHDRHTLDMVVLPFYPPSSRSAGAGAGAAAAETITVVDADHPTPTPANLRFVAAFGLAAHAHLVPTGTPFTALDSDSTVAPFLSGGDFFTYEDEHRALPTYHLVAMGGTFDNLHAGHKRLLAAASRVCTGTLTVGVTSDVYLARKKKKFGDMIEPVATRLARVREFLKRINPALQVEAVAIDDGAGPTTKRPEFEAIVASSETLEGCRWINARRCEQGWAPLQIITVARTDETNLSSTVIRRWKHEKAQQSIEDSKI